jgi:(2R)-3-sulfolactate dehydrogenase (NADP+)
MPNRKSINAMSSSTIDDTIQITLADVDELTYAALRAHGTNDANARCMALSIVAAEAGGIRSHGLMRVPTYCEHAASGKVDGNAVPTVVSTRPAAWIADAHDGFAHPAIEVGFECLVPAAKAQGVAALAVTNSYNCGVVGHHVERLALQGLVALAYANTPAAIAPWGGSKALFGTNPMAFAAPRANDPPLVIDQSSSVVARGEVMLHALQGKDIPSGWALDCNGVPTIDPRAALAGSMVPAGGYKGAGFALMVEILAAALTGATFSWHASSFADNKGGPPRTGQFFIAIDPAAFLGDQFGARMELLIQAMSAQPGVRLPGAKRVAARAAAAGGISVKRSLHENLLRLAKGH